MWLPCRAARTLASGRRRGGPSAACRLRCSCRRACLWRARSRPGLGSESECDAQSVFPNWAPALLSSPRPARSRAVSSKSAMGADQAASEPNSGAAVPIASPVTGVGLGGGRGHGLLLPADVHVFACQSPAPGTTSQPCWRNQPAFVLCFLKRGATLGPRRIHACIHGGNDRGACAGRERPRARITWPC